MRIFVVGNLGQLGNDFVEPCLTNAKKVATIGIFQGSGFVKKDTQSCLRVLSALTICIIMSCVPTGTPGSGNGASGTGSASETIDGKTYSASGYGGFAAGNAQDNNADVIQIANSTTDAGSNAINMFQIMIQTAAQTPGTYSVTNGVPITIMYYSNGSSSGIMVENGTIVLESIASASGQHTTGTFNGTYVDASGTHQITNGSFDEIR
jgi:membrane-bound inhibitor of C-type lysozyme